MTVFTCDECQGHHHIPVHLVTRFQTISTPTPKLRFWATKFNDFPKSCPTLRNSWIFQQNLNEILKHSKNKKNIRMSAFECKNTKEPRLILIVSEPNKIVFVLLLHLC